MNIEGADGNDFENNINYKNFSESRVLGLFHVRMCDWCFTPDSANKSLNIGSDDKLLILTLLPTKAGDRVSPYQLLRFYRFSLNLIAKYIEFHDLDSKYVLGVTHQGVAAGAKLFGFQTKELNPAENIAYRQDIGIHFIDSPRAQKGKDMGKVMFCYMTKEQFLEKFGDKYPLEV